MFDVVVDDNQNVHKYEHSMFFYFVFHDFAGKLRIVSTLRVFCGVVGGYLLTHLFVETADFATYCSDRLFKINYVSGNCSKLD